eukprot:jgi/Botrbrau1/975/Bobra.114_1s0016.1
MTDALAPAERHKFVCQGRSIYEWDQTLGDVNIYIELPPGLRAKDLTVKISSKHLTVGIKGNDPYLDHDFGGLVKAADCVWTVDGNNLNIQVAKAEKGEPWASAIAGHELNIVEQEEERKRLTLERFQEEHPGFDFSQATFTGDAPNPRTFLSDI